MNRTRGGPVADHVMLADNPWLRLRGLLGRPRPEADQGLLLTPCKAVHTCFMPYALDVVLLDRDRRVVGVVESLRPWSRTRWQSGVVAVLELSEGAVEATGLREGDRLDWTEAEPRRVA